MRTTSRMRSTLSRISRRGRRRTSRPKPTFSATVMFGQIAYDWKIIDMPRFSGGSEWPGAEIARPSSSMVPSVGSRKPAIIRSVVVLPQPEGPSSETNSPRASASVARSTAVKAPKRQVTSRSASLLTRYHRGGPRHGPPHPPALVAPRMNRGAPRSRVRSPMASDGLRAHARARPAEHEVAPDYAEAHHHQGDGDHDEDEADRGEQLEVALVALVEEQHRQHLGARRVEEDRRRQLARGRDEHEDEGAGEAALQQRRHHAAQRERPAAAEDAHGILQLGVDRPDGGVAVGVGDQLAVELAQAPAQIVQRHGLGFGRHGSGCSLKDSTPFYRGAA